jgi:hypothetical protein
MSTKGYHNLEISDCEFTSLFRAYSIRKEIGFKTVCEQEFNKSLAASFKQKMLFHLKTTKLGSRQTNHHG